MTMDGWKSSTEYLKIQCDTDFNLSKSSSGCEMEELNNSFELSLASLDATSSFMAPMPRKLNFANELELASSSTPIPNSTAHRSNPTFSPPYKKVRALRLFDSPATPKTLLEKCSNISATRARLFQSDNVHPRAVPCKMEKPIANVNPFTPESKFISILPDYIPLQPRFLTLSVDSSYSIFLE